MTAPWRDDALLIGFGLLILYSAGQTDVPDPGRGRLAPAARLARLGFTWRCVVYQISPRFLEWAAPALYGFSILLLVIVLAVGTGAGTAGPATAGSPSAAPDRAAVRARQARRGADAGPVPVRAARTPAIAARPAGACLIVGVPFLLVLKQPDLGSALVFVGILFAMLFWAGARPLLLFLLASPASACCWPSVRWAGRCG